MKFAVNVGSFKSFIGPVLSTSQKGIDKDFDKATRIMFRVADGAFEASAFNGRAAIVAAFGAKDAPNYAYECQEAGSVTVNAADLVKSIESFATKETVIFETQDSSTENVEKDLVIRKESDSDEFQTMPSYSEEVIIPAKASAFAKTISIKREVLTHCIKRIEWAVGFEQTKEEYLYWVMRVNKNKARFVAGTGSRFAVLDIEGDVLKADSTKTDIMFPKDHTPLISDVLASVGDDEVSIKESPVDGKEPFQIIVETSNYSLLLIGMNPSLKYVNEEMVLGQPYTYKFVTDASEWKYATKGISATFSDALKKAGRPHIANVTVDTTKPYFAIKTNDVMKASRKLTIIDSSIEQGLSSFDFNCCAPHLQDIADHADQSGYMQVEAAGATKPILVRYYASQKVDDAANLKKANAALNINESFTIMFATLVKK